MTCPRRYVRSCKVLYYLLLIHPFTLTSTTCAFNAHINLHLSANLLSPLVQAILNIWQQLNALLVPKVGLSIRDFYTQPSPGLTMKGPQKEKKKI